MRFFFLTLSLLSLTLVAMAQHPKKAIKKMKKGKYDLAKKILDQSLKKDSTHCALSYGYSIYFYSDTTDHHDLDQSYQYLKESIELCALDKTKKSKKSLKKMGVSLDSLRILKQSIEAQAYVRASDKGTLEAYQSYLNIYKDAQQITQATAQRDSLAFDRAKSIGTVEAFNDFVKAYPKAKQAQSAQYEHDLLIFEKETLYQRLKDYQDFVQNNPQSKVMSLALDKIYTLSTIHNTISSFEDFLKKYPNTGDDLQDQIKARLKSLYQEQGKIDAYVEKYQPSQVYSNTPIIPVIHNGKYAYFQNDYIIKDLDSIPSIYKCDPINMGSLIYIDSTKQGLMDLGAKSIHKANYDKIEYFGGGDYKAWKGKKVGLIHEGGMQTIPFEYDEIQPLAHLLMVRKGKDWGLRTIHDQDFVKVQYDSIYLDGTDLLILLDGEQYGFVTLSKAYDNFLNHETNAPSCNYDDIEWLGDQYLEVERSGKVGVITTHSRTILPPAFDQVVHHDKAWMIQHRDKWLVYRNTGSLLLSDSLDAIQYNDQVLACKSGKKWRLYDWQGEAQSPALDSVLVFPKLVVMIDGRTQKVLLPKDKVLECSRKDRLQCLTSKEDPNFFVLQRQHQNRKKSLYDAEGNQIIKALYDNFYVLQNHLISAQRGDKFELFGPDGTKLTDGRYDGIGESRDGFVPLLLGGHFGIYKSDTIFIPPTYDQVPVLFSKKSKLWIVKTEEGKGIINTQNEIILPCQQDELFFWTDSTALARRDSSWSVLNFYDLTYSYPCEEIEWLEEPQQPQDPSKEIQVLYKSKGKVGVLSNKRGILIPPVYEYISQISDGTRQLYFRCEHTLPKDPTEEIDIIEVAFYNPDGKLILTQKYTEEEIEKLECDD